MNVVITGANRGIGLGLVGRYLRAGDSVIAGCRDPDAAHELKALSASGDLGIKSLDIGSAHSIHQFAESLSGQPVDVLINNAGVGGGTEQSFMEINEADWLEVLRINTLAPMFVTRALLDNVRRGKLKKVMMMSSQLGAISYPSIGYYAYETAKAALNKAVRALAQDLEKDGICVCALHPGWVKTDMGGPGAPLDVESATTGLVSTIAKLDLKESGGFWQWNGKPHDW